MTVVIMIFMIVSTLFALATLGYVVVDVVMEKQNQEKSKIEPKAPKEEP